MALAIPASIGSVTGWISDGIGLLGGGTSDEERRALVDKYYQRAITGDGVALETLKCWSGAGVVNEAVAAERGVQVGATCGMASTFGRTYAAAKYAEAYARVNGAGILRDVGVNALGTAETLQPTILPVAGKIGLVILAAVVVWYISKR